MNSVLYIVQLERTAGQFDQFLLCISVVSKIIRERNSITGLTKEKWPLSILESCESTETGVILKFDTVKRDKQTRTYVIEDEKDRQVSNFTLIVGGIFSPSICLDQKHIFLKFIVNLKCF